MKYVTLIAFAITNIFSTSFVFAQGETALPFLLITSSPEGNGMAGISASVLTDNATAPIANPGQLGLQSLTNYFSASTYAPKTQWLPQFQQSDLTYLSSSVNAGINLRRVIPLPIPVSIGFGYSHIFLNLGKYTYQPPGPDPELIFEAYEKSDNFTFGVGVDYFIQAGIGFTSKSVKSVLFPFTTQSIGVVGIEEVSTNDFGIIAHIPVFGIVSKLRSEPLTIFPNTEPLFDIILGYARTNLGDKGVTYFPNEPPDPLPRAATIGLSWKAGLISHTVPQGWEVVSFTIAREAQDILVNRFPEVIDSNTGFTVQPAGWDYQNGFGDLQFFKNLILGEGYPEVWLRKGWQASVGEFMIVRGGSLHAPGLDYTSEGFAFRLSGVLKFVSFLTRGNVSASLYRFALDHLDLQYDHASESQSDGGPRSGTTYNGLNLIIK